MTNHNKVIFLSSHI